MQYYHKNVELTGVLVETEEQQEDSGDGDKGTTSFKIQKCEMKDGEGPTIYVKQTSTGEILVKRNFVDTSDTIHVRKRMIRLTSDSENRSVMQIKPKGDNDHILIPIKVHTTDVVKDSYNTFIVNKSKTLSDKKYGVHNQNVSSVNCVQQSVSESDGNTIIKMKRINKLEDAVTENKKLKKNEC